MSKMRINIATVSAPRRALVGRWLTAAMEQMYAAEGVDKGFTPEETRVIHHTVDQIASFFDPPVEWEVRYNIMGSSALLYEKVMARSEESALTKFHEKHPTYKRENGYIVHGADLVEAK
jgi:hypothetical protein